MTSIFVIYWPRFCPFVHFVIVQYCIYCLIYRPILYLCFLGGNHPRNIHQKYGYHCWKWNFFIVVSNPFSFPIFLAKCPDIAFFRPPRLRHISNSVFATLPCGSYRGRACDSLLLSLSRHYLFLLLRYTSTQSQKLFT